jgi:hypothetical protein
MLQKVNKKYGMYGKYLLSAYVFMFCLMVSAYSYATPEASTTLIGYLEKEVKALGVDISTAAAAAFLALAAIGVAIFTYKAIKKIISAA